MTKHHGTKASAAICAGLLSLALIGCGSGSTPASEASAANNTTTETAVVSNATTAAATNANETSANSSDTYTDRDLRQTADTSGAKAITVQSGEDVNITEEGVYVLSGTATNATVRVQADETAKVQLVLDGLNITNETAPAIYVLSADKVFVTTAEGSQNGLSVTGAFAADGETALDGAIFSKDDLVLNGLGTLTINSSDHGVVAKDDLKVTGGTYTITTSGDAMQANDGIYVAGGTFTMEAGSDGLQGDVLVQVDGGTMNIRAAEGIESTTVQINDGTIEISASDDGINATTKSNDASVTPSITIAGGDVAITMGQGDTDALDANGSIYITGGTVNITAQSAFDFDQTAELTGGTVYVNGEQVSTIENSMMGGGMGGHGGMMGEGGPGGMGGRHGEFQDGGPQGDMSMGGTTQGDVMQG